MREQKTLNCERWGPIAVLALSLALLYILWRVLMIFILATLFAFIVYPAVRFFDRKLPRPLSILAVYFLLLTLAVIVGGIFWPAVSKQFQDFAQAAPGYFQRIQELIDTIQLKYIKLPENWRLIIDNLLGELQRSAVRIAPLTIPIAIGVFTVVLVLALIPLLGFFMLLDCASYKETLLAVVPKQHRRMVEDLLACMGTMLWGAIKGRLILMVTVGVVTGVGLSLVGMPYPVVFGLLAGILEMIPSFGPVFGTIVITIFALAVNPTLFVKAGIVAVGVQILENIFLSPVVLSRTAGLSPITVMLALLIGGTVGGVPGALVAIPMAMVVKIVIFYFYADEHLLEPLGVLARGSHQRRKEDIRRPPRPTRKGPSW